MGKLRNFRFFSVITRRLNFHSYRVNGKVVIVTGASSGIGRAKTPEGKLIIALQRLLPTLLDHVVYRQMAKEPDSPFK